MANYTNQAEIEALLKRSLTASELVLLQILLDTADSFINDQLQSSYGVIAETARYYNGTGGTIIDIDACNTISKVEGVDRLEADAIDFIEDSDYEAFPRNETVKRWLEFRCFPLPYGVSNIQVTAKFNLGDTPPNEIKYLAAYIVSNLIIIDTTTLNLKSESIEGYSRTFADVSQSTFANDPIVFGILDKYRRNDVLF